MKWHRPNLLALLMAVGIPVFVTVDWIRETCRARRARKGGGRR